MSAEAYRGIQARHARAVVLAATDEVARRLREDPGAVSARDLVAVVRELHNVERALEGAPSTIAGVIRADGASAALAELIQQAAGSGMGSNRFERGKIPPREDRPAVVVEAVARQKTSEKNERSKPEGKWSYLQYAGKIREPLV